MTGTARRPVRMCARCGTTTEDPVLVHEVHAAAGAGCNVYACHECALHYPPLTDTLELLDATPRPSRMTIRVYRVMSDGRVADDRGETRTYTGSRIDSAPWSTALSPCACPGCGSS